MSSENRPCHGAQVEGQSDQEPFRLLDLPPELWVKIGQFAVDEASDITYDIFMPEDWFEILRRSKKKTRERLLQPALTRTCRALRNELLPYHYQTNVNIRFDFRPVLAYPDTITSYTENFGHWIRPLGNLHLRHICERVRIRLPAEEADSWKTMASEAWDCDVKLEVIKEADQDVEERQQIWSDVWLANGKKVGSYQFKISRRGTRKPMAAAEEFICDEERSRQGLLEASSHGR